MKAQPYWLDTAPCLHATAGELPNEADVVVIGGGFTGLSAARSLALAGADVIVVERDRILSEASGRNGGHCNTGVAHDFATLISQVGEASAIYWQKCFTDAVDYVEDLIIEESIACDFKRTGKLKLAVKPGHLKALQATAVALRKHTSADTEFLDKKALADEVRSPAFYGGLLDRRGAQMHMGRFGTGLAQAACRHGARIYEHAKVTELHRESGDQHHIVTERGSVRARKVLLATGCSNQGPFPWFQRRIVPVGSFIIVTEPLDKDLAQYLLPHDRTYVTTQNIGNYFRLTSDSRLLFGGRARFTMSESKALHKSAAILQHQLRRLLPEAGKVRMDYCWGGMVDMTVDRLPRAGVHQGLYYALGYSGHGTQMSVWMGDVMADQMLGRARQNPWDQAAWKALPGYRGKPWFLPILGLYYRAKDFIF